MTKRFRRILTGLSLPFFGASLEGSESGEQSGCGPPWSAQGAEDRASTPSRSTAEPGRFVSFVFRKRRAAMSDTESKPVKGEGGDEGSEKMNLKVKDTVRPSALSRSLLAAGDQKCARRRAPLPPSG